MARAKAKITKLRNGRFQIDILDSRGKRTRPSYETRPEAVAAHAEFEAQKAKGQFRVDSLKHTLSDAFDLLLQRKERDGKGVKHLRRMRHVIEKHLRPNFGARKLDDFHTQRARFWQEWLDRRADEDRIAPQTLAHEHSYMRMALDEAITADWLDPPNPIDAYRIIVPQTNRTHPREPLKLTEVSALIKVVTSSRGHRENELTWRSTFIEILLGLLCGFRNQECSGLFWDCVNFDSRIIHQRRIHRDGKIVWSSKTGKQGQRNVPMSPILFVALRSHQEQLRELGCKVEGEAPVLVTERAKIVGPYAIGDHWNQVARKAGFGEKHDFYALRHTFASVLITVGLPIDRLKRLMGHTNILTTDSKYMHDMPDYDPIRRDVEDVFQQFRLERSPESYIDALGIAFARRWKDEGMEIGCAEPRSLTPQLDHNGVKLLQGNIIDVMPTAESIDPPALGPVIRSTRTLRAWQMAECQKRHAQGQTKRRIAEDLDLCTGTVSNWIRTVPDARWMRKTSLAEKAEIKQRVLKYADAHPEASTTEIAAKFCIKPYLVARYRKQVGKPMPHRPGAHKLGQHEKLIREMFTAGKTTYEMARATGRSKSAIAYFINRLGLRGGVRPIGSGRGARKLWKYEAQIREMVAEGKSDWAISRELAEASPAGIAAFIGRNGLRKPATSSENVAETPMK